MIDLETLGLSNDAAIMSVGAVCFDHAGNTIDQFYEEVGAASNLAQGRKIEPSTLLWWLENDAEEIIRLMLSSGDLLWVIQCFREWVSGFDPVCVWSCGTDFDIPIMNSFGDMPWVHHQVMDYRTLRNSLGFLVPNPPVREGLHNALSDAEYQTKVLIEINEAAKKAMVRC